MTNTNSSLTASQFIKKLEELGDTSQKGKYENVFKYVKDDQFIGVPMGKVFALAKENYLMDLNQVEKLLESPIHEARVGAVSILDFQARDKKISEEQKKVAFGLYLKRHDRINTWDLVDRSAIYVIGSYLKDKDRKILYKLAASKKPMERRTSIISTAYFMMKLKETGDTFKLAEILVNDTDELVQKAVGWMLRVAGDIDKKKLEEFLDLYANKMPRVMLRNAVEKFSKEEKKHYMSI